MLRSSEWVAGLDVPRCHPREQFNFPPHLLCVYGLHFIKFRETCPGQLSARWRWRSVGWSLGGQSECSKGSPARLEGDKRDLKCSRLLYNRLHCHGSDPPQFSSSIKRCLSTSTSGVDVCLWHAAVHVSVRCRFIICNAWLSAGTWPGGGRHPAQKLRRSCQFITSRRGWMAGWFEQSTAAERAYWKSPMSIKDHSSWVDGKEINNKKE